MFSNARFMSGSPFARPARAPSIAWLREQVAFIEKQQQAGRTTYVHYAAGINRSGMVVTGYVMRKHDWPRQSLGVRPLKAAAGLSEPGIHGVAERVGEGDEQTLVRG